MTLSFTVIQFAGTASGIFYAILALHFVDAISLRFLVPISRRGRKTVQVTTKKKVEEATFRLQRTKLLWKLFKVIRMCKSWRRNIKKKENKMWKSCVCE